MRIVGGELRGRRLHAPAGRATRPTSERARTGLFDWIASDLAGARVLDLYAGTGALGAESLSRGAVEVVFVERARPALKALERNRAELGLEARSRVVALAVDRALALLRRRSERFDLIFADPPYEARPSAELRGVAELLSEGGILVLERSRRAEPAFHPSAGSESPRGGGPGLRWVGAKVYGETAFDQYERDEPAGTGEGG